MNKFILLILGVGCFAAYGDELIIRGSGATVTPKIPATCHDGMRHTKLNAIDQVTLSETNDYVSLSYRIYMVDCFFHDGEMEANIYGPLHSGRCDESVIPYGGVFPYSKMVKLGEGPLSSIEVCHTEIRFDKTKLAPGDNLYKYVYRYDAVSHYEWTLNINYDVTQQKYTQSVTQMPEGTVGNNLDRYVGAQGAVCNYDALIKGLQGFGIEAPIAKVAGSNLILSFYAVGFSCKQVDGKYLWARDKMKTGDYVTVRNSANSPVGYDWNIFRHPINRNIIGNFLTFVMPLQEVLEPEELAQLRDGKMVSTAFKVSAGMSNYMGPLGYLVLNVNLDPLAVEN